MKILFPFIALFAVACSDNQQAPIQPIEEPLAEVIETQDPNSADVPCDVGDDNLVCSQQ